jgi:hypothetical protein
MEMLNEGEVVFRIWCNGDRTVGDYGSRANVIVWVGFEKEYLNFVREQLEDCFTKIWDDTSVIAMTDEEYKKYTSED